MCCKVMDLNGRCLARCEEQTKGGGTEEVGRKQGNRGRGVPSLHLCPRHFTVAVPDWDCHYEVTWAHVDGWDR